MTTTTEPTTDDAVQEVNTAPEQPEQAPESTEDTPTRKGSAEAAKWRVRLRETEAERDQLRDRLVALQHADAVRQATGPGRLIDGEDLFRTAELDSLLDEDGNLDPDKIGEAVDQLIADKPHLAEKRVTGDVGQGDRGRAASTSWADVIRG